MELPLPGSQAWLGSRFATAATACGAVEGVLGAELVTDPWAT